MSPLLSAELHAEDVKAYTYMISKECPYFPNRLGMDTEQGSRVPNDPASNKFGKGTEH